MFIKMPSIVNGAFFFLSRETIFLVTFMELWKALHLTIRKPDLKKQKVVHYVFVNNCRKSFLF